MKITWITDGHGWGHDAQVNELVKRIPGHDHTIIYRRRAGRTFGGKVILEIYELFVERLRKTEPDIIMAMHYRGVDESMLGIAICRVCGNR